MTFSNLTLWSPNRECHKVAKIWRPYVRRPYDATPLALISTAVQRTVFEMFEFFFFKFLVEHGIGFSEVLAKLL